MYTTGSRVDHGQFSRDMVGTTVGDYAYTATQLSNQRWNNIKNLCDDGREKPDSDLKAHMVQLNRRALYERSSPTKESDDESESESKVLLFMSRPLQWPHVWLLLL